MLRMVFKKKENVPLVGEFREEFMAKNKNPLRRALYVYEFRENSEHVIFEIGQKGYESNLKAFLMLMFYLSSLSDRHLDDYIRKVRKRNMLLLARDKNGMLLKTIFMKMDDREFEAFMKNLKPNLERFEACIATNNLDEFLLHDDCADMLYAFSDMQKYIVGLLTFRNNTQDFIEKRFNLKMVGSMFYMPFPKRKRKSDICEVPNCGEKAAVELETLDGNMWLCGRHNEAYELVRKVGKAEGAGK